MIHYQLRCAEDHAFDGWFKDSAAFDAQAGRGLVACPQCGDVQVRRGLMAPAVAKRGSGEAAKAPGQASGPVVDESGQPVSKPAPPPAAGGRMPDHIRGMLQRFRAEVEKSCENVGDSFATEARRIHNGESEARGIYGNATPEQAEALADDGIEVARIPWVPRAAG